MKMECSVEISQAPHTIFPWITEPEKAMRWQGEVQSYEILKPDERIVGTEFREIVADSSGRLELHGVVTDLIEDREIAFRITSRVHELHVRYSLDEKNGFTVVSVHSDIRWKFPISLIVLLNGRKIGDDILEQMKKELGRLKELAETAD